MNPRRLAELELTPRWRRRVAAAIVPTVHEPRPEPGGVPVEAGEVAPPFADAATGTRASAVSAPLAVPTHDPAAGVDPQRAAIARMDWAQLGEAVAACRACGLHAGRRQAVLGVGDPDASWLFVGEGPGAEEDAKGEPFVGQAGRLLDNMLKSVGLARGRDVYIANVVKCRPPQNRTPSAEEGAACAPYLARQIELIRPLLIVAMGKTAVLNLLGSDASMAALRGRVHRYGALPVVVTYHPAYLLRKPADKAKAWEDLCLALDTREALQAKPAVPI